MKKHKNKIHVLLVFSAVFSFFLFSNPGTIHAGPCTILSATFSPSGNQTFKDDAPFTVNITIVGGRECIGESVDVSIYQNNNPLVVPGGDTAVPEFSHYLVTFNTTSFSIINTKVGETGCNPGALGSFNDCEYYIKVGDFPSEGKTGGELNFDCDTSCDEKWVPGKVEQAPAPPLVPKCDLPQVLKDGKCVDPDPNYHLLSPLPCKEGQDGCKFKDGTWVLTTFDPTGGGGGGLGGYLNIAIIIFIGFCGVLAVVVIVLGGIEYMTSDYISSKESAKQRISGAVFGLLLACGCWIILYEINPNLLKTDFTSLVDQKVSVDIMDETETFASALDGDSPLASGMATSFCPEGIVRTASGAPACKRIAAKFDRMIADAKLAGKIISGYGYRNIANQTQLRKNNCNGNVTDRDAHCTPPTALPGASNHNHGLAFDLRCTEAGGVSKKIATQDNVCFVWLRANASKYGFYNLPSEPWHWSVNGR